MRWSLLSYIKLLMGMRGTCQSYIQSLAFCNPYFQSKFSSIFRPLRNHVMKIERQLINLVQERKGQLEELYELKYAKYFFHVAKLMYLSKTRGPEQRSEWKRCSLGVAGGDGGRECPHERDHREAATREEGAAAEDEGGGGCDNLLVRKVISSSV